MTESDLNLNQASKQFLAPPSPMNKSKNTDQQKSFQNMSKHWVKNVLEDHSRFLLEKEVATKFQTKDMRRWDALKKKESAKHQKAGVVPGSNKRGGKTAKRQSKIKQNQDKLGFQPLTEQLVGNEIEILKEKPEEEDLVTARQPAIVDLKAEKSGNSPRALLIGDQHDQSSIKDVMKTDHSMSGMSQFIQQNNLSKLMVAQEPNAQNDANVRQSWNIPGLNFNKIDGVNAGAAGQEIKVEISPRDKQLQRKQGIVANNDKSLNLELHNI